MPVMTLRPEPWRDASPADVDWLEERLYAFNVAATGRSDGDGLAFAIRDEAGAVVGAAAGYTWAGVSEIRQMWVDEAYRGRGLGPALLEAMVGEARRRGVKRVYVASYDFQAPGFYEKAGFVRIAEFDGWPEGHVNVILCKSLE